ncbi:hypothetical protein OESDEN_15545 [Oesophagostomum dentatum]|uniref:Uncharacterized protein n=1 Tax=Oesophagostomum dentatum TaxID=61180 RepID=A0A0B1SHE4_OESDE|nr:hypothetical protein OESDEN_15545 [Oesophagostomum dentatum]
MLSVCHKNDEECMKGIPPQCSRTLRKRQLPGDFSIEERLKQLYAQLEMKNYTDDVDLGSYDDVLIDVQATTTVANVAARPLFIDEPESAPHRCMPYTYLHWIYALLITNILSILVAVLACSNLLKRRFSLDIANIRHKYRSPF